MFSYLQNGIVSLFACQAYVFLIIECDSVIVCLLCLCSLIYRMGQCHCLLVMLMFSYLQNVIVSLFACLAYVFLFLEWIVSLFACYAYVSLFIGCDSVIVCLLSLCFLIYGNGLCKGCSLNFCFLIYRKGQCHCLVVRLIFSYLQKRIMSRLLSRLLFSYVQKGILSFFGCQAYVFLFIEWDSVIVCMLCLCFLIYRMGQCHYLLVCHMFSYLQNVIL